MTGLGELEDRDQQVFLVGEQPVEVPGGDRGPRADLADRGLVEAFDAEQMDRGVDKSGPPGLFALLVRLARIDRIRTSI